MRRITRDQARRFALAAQGFNQPRPSGRIDVRHFRRVVDRVGMIQLDSVNVFSRTHYMPFFSRLGPYDRQALDDYLWGSGEMFEYWGHEASLIPARDHRLWRWRMGRMKWDRFDQIDNEHPGYMDAVLAQVRADGPLRTADLEDPGVRGSSGMWDWSKGKVALEALFMKGRVTTAGRPNFVRIYDLMERVVAAEHLEQPDLTREEAHRELVLQSAQSLGVATVNDIADYPRIGVPDVRPIVAAMARTGELIELEVEGWDKPGYLHPDAVLPRKPAGTALLSPFDSLVWYRDRTERLWDFHYRIEIYTPEPKRVYGYYVLPFLFDGDLVARADLKTDRKTRRLLVKGSFAESGVDPVRVGAALLAELETVAKWLDLEDVEVFPNGDLAGYLR